MRMAGSSEESVCRGYDSQRLQLEHMMHAQHTPSPRNENTLNSPPRPPSHAQLGPPPPAPAPSPIPLQTAPRSRPDVQLMQRPWPIFVPQLRTPQVHCLRDQMMGRKGREGRKWIRTSSVHHHDGLTSVHTFEQTTPPRAPDSSS